MELSCKPEARGPAVQGSAGLKRIREVAFRTQMELSYKPETGGPAVQGSAGLKRIWVMSIQAADGALIQARYPGSCSTRQCRVKSEMGIKYSVRR